VCRMAVIPVVEFVRDGREAPQAEPQVAKSTYVRVAMHRRAMPCEDWSAIGHAMRSRVVTSLSGRPPEGARELDYADAQVSESESPNGSVRVELPATSPAVPRPRPTA
jgi:hypothetical protein